jgi:hypothetical protein
MQIPIQHLTIPADPDPTFHYDANPDSASQNDAVPLNSDPHQFHSEPSIIGQCGFGSGCGSRVLVTKTFKNAKWTANFFFYIIIAIYLSIGRRRKGRSSYMRSLQPSKVNICKVNDSRKRITIGYW